MKTVRIFAAAILAAAFSFTAPASACELVCVETSNVYDGNLGGLAGADAKCQAEFPGFKFPRNSSFAIRGLSAQGFRGAQYNSGTTRYIAWAGTTTVVTIHDYGESFSQSDTQYSCSAWNSSSPTTILGGVIERYNSAYGEGRLALTSPVACNFRLPLICCNM